MPLQSEEVLSHPVPMALVTASRDSLLRELAAETLRQFSEVRFVALGSSMLPTIYPGDCLTVTSYGGGVPCCGDIVLYRRSGEFRVHRIVGIEGDGPARSYHLRGDALAEHDPSISRAEILGRVDVLLRRGKLVAIDSVYEWPHRILRWIVLHSEFSTSLLLSLHAWRSRTHDYPPGKSAEVKVECS